MHVTLVIPTLNQYPRLLKTLQSVEAQVLRPDRVLIIDNGRKLLFPFMDGSTYIKPSLARELNLHILTPPANKGVAGSCNEALRQAETWWLHSNDDTEWDKELLLKLWTAAMADWDKEILDFETLPHMYLPDYGVGSAFTLFLMHKSIVDHIGWWDESFYPIYFEDNDFGYRMNLAGVKRKVVENCRYTHYTSSTLNSLPAEKRSEHHANFEKLRAYYVQKWGGPPGEEKYSKPFDGGSIVPVDKTWWSRFGRE